jgi:hypothetical protein
MTHPGFLDQPFVKVPNPHPDEDIDFRAGEVIYSNPKAMEWGRLLYMATTSFWLYSGLFWPLSMFYKTHIPNALMNDTVDSAYIEFSMMNLDTVGFSIVAFPIGIVTYGYLLHKLYHKEAKKFVSKIQYNKTKDLIFVTTMSEGGQVQENCFEVANIEHVTPSVKSVGDKLSVMDKGGFMVLENLAGDETFYGKEFFIINGSQNG